MIIAVCILHEQIYSANEDIVIPSLTESDTLYQQANDLLANGKYQEAANAYKKLETKYPNNVGIYFNEGLALKQLGRYQEALDMFQRIIKQNPQSIPTNYEIGNIYEKLNNLKAAQTWYQKAIGMTPQSALSYYYRGSAYKKLGKEQESKNDFLSAYQLDPRFEGLAREYNLAEEDTIENEEVENQNLTTYEKIEDYLNSGNNKYLIILITILLIADMVLLIINSKRKAKKKLLMLATLDFVQGDLGLYTFNIENDEIDYVDKTQKLISGWDTKKVRESLDKLNQRYSILDHEILIEVRLILQRELEFRAFD